jgi:hypothetical protein
MKEFLVSTSWFHCILKGSWRNLEYFIVDQIGCILHQKQLAEWALWAQEQQWKGDTAVCSWCQGLQKIWLGHLITPTPGAWSRAQATKETGPLGQRLPGISWPDVPETQPFTQGRFGEAMSIITLYTDPSSSKQHASAHRTAKNTNVTSRDPAHNCWAQWQLEVEAKLWFPLFPENLSSLHGGSNHKVGPQPVHTKSIVNYKRQTSQSSSATSASYWDSQSLSFPNVK